METNSPHYKLLGLFLATVLSTGSAIGQDDAGSNDPVFELSPFEVETSGDKGYYASNAISGSRISVPIQDMPLTIEVVTSEFIEDTGATDLRDSLKYSAGILLQSQNDAYGSTSNVGQINNPEGATGNKSDSSFKIRGFVLENTLRNGFRRQHATDTINIDRIEVVRGPSALLYGVGNFGGVVNYVTKTPLPEFQQNFSIGVGSDSFQRASIDSTGPLFLENLGYRLSMAIEDRESWTDINTEDHFFIAPVLQWRIFDRIKLTLDYEYGKADENGVSFRSVRTPSLEGVNIFQSDRLETFGFLEFSEDKNANQVLDPGEDLNDNGQIDFTRDPRTFRWSGPDTFIDTESQNANFSVEVKILDNLYYNGGLNYSRVNFVTRDVFGGISRGSGADAAQVILDDMQANGRGFLARQVIDGKNSDTVVPVYDGVFQYNWVGSDEQIDWLQHRHELNFSDRIFEGNKWLESEHNILLGYSFESQDYENTAYRSNGATDDFMYKDPTDESYIRFDTIWDGSPSLPYEPLRIDGNTAENVGMYGVYSGRFFDDRLFLVAGIREDTTQSKDGFGEVIGSRQGRQFFEDSEVKKQTSQFGISVEVIEGFTLFALQSEGVEPNFGGERDGNGIALDSTVADATEYGFKFNLFDGRIAGTISKFNIQREGLPFRYWWAPAPVHGQFRPSDDIIYRLDGVNPDIANRDPDTGEIINPYQRATEAEWLAAKAATGSGPKGAVYTQSNDDGTFTYLNASTPEGAAWLDAIFRELQDAFLLPLDDPNKDLDPWLGFLYEGLDDEEVNTASEDRSDQGYYQSISDESDGWEAQIIMSPLENLQIILNYSHVERQVIDPGAFVQTPFVEGNEDRWATWFFPNANWGLGGAPVELVYPGGDGPYLPNTDTSSWTGVGWGKGESLDDTPEDVVSWWAHYTFLEDSLFSGLEIGFGGQWESEREYASAFTSAGQKKQNETGTTIKAVTDARLTLNAMAKYSWVRDSYDAFLQLNVDNFLDDQDQYGYIWAPGISWKINFGVTF
ncbi:TonB-dependent receptor plug domain-containing protein [Puniceicoccales bacterium CK1056]|uniref:TonB-dependent receptor plug domain-containing protein n=1 Tax=Oceanipulchritudo coccoides TaxID=2706888 RepID=A0A6B2M6E3_9BACT|nr:TonB-dependent receptor plug domain-containing protein [Oceanipulchritudo coccoides]NDV63240.1 TonB-dependent receptor plug domain-containing protein [Oceanipulchritudo coccoides]